MLSSLKLVSYPWSSELDLARQWDGEHDAKPHSLKLSVSLQPSLLFFHCTFVQTRVAIDMHPTLAPFTALCAVLQDEITLTDKTVLPLLAMSRELGVAACEVRAHECIWHGNR